MERRMSYHQSKLKNYFACPKMFNLSLQHEPEFGTSTEDAMRNGNLFEGYVFGFKPDKDEKTLVGKKKEDTIAGIKADAMFAKRLFKSGEPYVKLHHALKDYDLNGEADHIGELNWEELGKMFPGAIAEGKSINDLKYTKSLDFGKVGIMESGKDYFQALQYVSIHYLNTGELLPFIYIVVESNYSTPLVRLEKVFIDKTDVTTKFLPFVDRVHNDLFKQAEPSFDTCLGGKGGSRCWFLQWCNEGRLFAGGYRTVSYSILPFTNQER